MRPKHCALRSFVAISAKGLSHRAGILLPSANEGGVSFWFPGLYGSLAAVPQVPGGAVGFVDLYVPVNASAKRCRSARGHDQQVQPDGKRQPQCQSKGQSERYSSQSDLCFRDACLWRPTGP
jgi:hypothetical protein